MLSVFGATYTAISAFRTHYNPILAEALKLVEQKLHDIRRLRGEPYVAANQRHATKMKTCYRWWHWSHIAPIVLFVIFSFSVAVWVVWGDFDKNLAGDGEKGLCRTLISWCIAINAVSLLTSLLTYLAFRSASGNLDEHWDLAVRSSVQPPGGG